MIKNKLIWLLILITLYSIFYVGCDESNLYFSLRTETFETIRIQKVEIENINKVAITFDSTIIQDNAADLSNYEVVSSIEGDEITVLDAELETEYKIIVTTSLFTQERSYQINIYNLESTMALPIPSSGLSADFTVPFLADFTEVNLYTPTDGKVVDSTPVLTWSSKFGAVGYILEISEDSDFSNILLSAETEDNFFEITEEELVLEPVIYYWRVRAQFSGYQADYSNVFTFNVVSTDDNAMIYVWADFSGISAGNKTNPLKSIQSGIDFALEQGINKVVVAKGQYTESLIMKNGVNVYGGYNPDNWEERDYTVYESTILIKGENAVSFFGTDDVVFDGFTITYPEGIDYQFTGFFCNSASAVISNNIVTCDKLVSCCNNASPVFENNTMTGKPLAGQSTYTAITINNASPVFLNNTISADISDIGHISFIQIYTNANITFNGNVINNGDATIDSTCFYNVNSSGTIQNNEINQGQHNGADAIIIYNEYSDMHILNNSINENEDVVNGTTYMIHNYHSSTLIDGNDINSGKIGGYTYCILEEESSSTIINNNIFGKENDNSSYGISLWNSSSIIINNNISGGNTIYADTVAIGISIYADSIIEDNPVIINNNIFTQGTSNYRFGIVEEGDYGLSSPVSINNNNIFDCPAGLYADFLDYGNGTGNCDVFSGGSNDWQCLTTAAELNDFNLTNQRDASSSQNNISQDPQFYDSANYDFTFTISSPCDITQGGMLKSDVLENDINRTERTSIWSIGAYEYDETCIP